MGALLQLVGRDPLTPDHRRRPVLAETVARVNADLVDGIRLEIGRRQGSGWVSLGDVSDAAVDGLLAQFEPHCAGRRDYLGAAVTAVVAHAVVVAGWTMLLVERRLPDLAGANLSIHCEPGEAWFDRVAIHHPGGAVLATDLASGDPTVEVLPDVGGLHGLLVDALTATLGPWFAALRARTSFGMCGMWGQVADDLCATALWVGAAAGLDQLRAWAEAMAVVDRLARAVPHPAAVRALT